MPPIFLVYFAVLASRPLTGSARAAALTTAFATVSYAVLSAAFLLGGGLRVVSSPLDVATVDTASLLDEATKVLLLLTVGAISTYATVWHAGILRRALAAQVRRAAEERELAGRLLEADKLSAIGTIAAAAVHEVRNPLTTINSASAAIVAHETGWTAISARMSSASSVRLAGPMASSRTCCGSLGLRPWMTSQLRYPCPTSSPRH